MDVDRLVRGAGFLERRTGSEAARAGDLEELEHASPLPRAPRLRAAALARPSARGGRAGASSISSPRRPALTWIVSKPSADSSSTRRQPLALAERADPAGDVARSSARASFGSAIAARLPSALRSSCAATGTTATVRDPSTSATSVLNTRAGSTPSFSAASRPYEAAFGIVRVLVHA